MSGVFGLVRSNPTEQLDKTLEGMAGALRLQPWSRASGRILPGGCVGLGQANIGIFSSEEQPVFSQTGRVAAVAYGWVSNAPTLRAALEKTGTPLSTGSAAELAVRLYQQRGLDLAGEMEGEFILAVWDATLQRLVIANDRHAMLPHYYARLKEGGLAFAPLISALLRAGTLDRHLNLPAVAEFLRFQRVLGSKTFIEEVSALPYASILVYDARSDELTCRHYWDFDRIQSWPGVSFKDSVEETARLLRASLERALALPYRQGVFLSGGLDSRTLLGYANRRRPPLPSLTYGHPGSSDVRYARQLARRLGSPNIYIPHEDGSFLLDAIDLHLSATEGFTSFIHAHGAKALLPGRALMDVNLVGHMGDNLLGCRTFGAELAAWNAPDDLSFHTHLYHLFNQEYSWPGITEGEERVLFQPRYDHLLRGLAFDSLGQELQPFLGLPSAQRLVWFTFLKSYNQMYLHNLTHLRTHFETVAPFCDYRLVDWLLSMPLEYRFQDRLYLEVINREIPEVTRVPREVDDLLPTTNRWLHAADRLVVRVKRHLPFLPHPTQQIHGDPEVWLRDDLRGWVAGVLFDERTLERGIFNPAFLRSIFERHMGGKEPWTVGKIAPLVTFELMMRRYFDAPESEPEIALEPGFSAALR